MENPRIKELIVKIMRNADIILPGEQELLDLTGMETEKDAVKKLLEDGTVAVVVKRGDRGATLYTETEEISVDSVKVTEVDPTGAGDCFGGTFVSLVSQGYSYKEALFYANLAGAYSVTKQGPMEGNLTKEEIDNIYKK